MTEEAYLRRDADMDNDEHASNRKLTTWYGPNSGKSRQILISSRVLCSREDPESLEFKCSCET